METAAYNDSITFNGLTRTDVVVGGSGGNGGNSGLVRGGSIYNDAGETLSVAGAGSIGTTYVGWTGSSGDGGNGREAFVIGFPGVLGSTLVRATPGRNGGRGGGSGAGQGGALFTMQSSLTLTNFNEGGTLNDLGGGGAEVEIAGVKDMRALTRN